MGATTGFESGFLSPDPPGFLLSSGFLSPDPPGFLLSSGFLATVLFEAVELEAAFLSSCLLADLTV